MDAIKLDRGDIAAAVGFCSSVTRRSPAVPILQNLALDVEGTSLTITGGDMDTFARVRMTVDPVAAPAATTVNAKVMCEWLEAVPATEPVEMTWGSDELTMRCGGSRLRMLASRRSDYPKAEFCSYEGASYDYDVLTKALRKVGLATLSSQPMRGTPLSGICFDGEYIVGTDGYRLHLYDIGAVAPRPFIMSAEMAAALRRMPADKSGTVTIGINEDGSMITATAGDATILSRAIAGDYADWRKVMPKKEECAASATFSKDAMLATLRRVGVLAEAEWWLKRIVVDWRTGEVTVSATEIGSGSDVVDVEVAGDAVQMAVNIALLRDAIRAFDASVITAYMTGSNKALLLESEDAPFAAVVMPMQLHGA